MDTILTEGDSLSTRVKVTDSAANVEYFTASGVVGSVAGLVSEVTMGSVTYTFSEPVVAGLDLTGRAYVVDPGSGVTVTAISPAATGSGSTLRNGAQKNPFFGASFPQGYDGRYASYNASELASVPISLVAGDTIIKAISGPIIETRKGDFSEFAVLHCVSRAPTAMEALGPTVKYNGTRNEFYTADIDAWYSAREVQPHAGVSFPSYSSMINSISKCWPTFGQVHNNSTKLGYEMFSPSGLGDYSRNVVRNIGNIMLAMTTNVFSEAETKELARKILMHGIEMGDPWTYNTDAGVLLDAEGGHGQHHQGPAIFALGLTGRSSLISQFMAKGPGAYQSCYRMDATFRDTFISGHTASNKSYIYRHRTLPAQPGGTTLRIPLVSGNSTSGNDWFQNKIHAGSRVIRVSDSAEATLAASFNPNDIKPNGTSYTKDVTLTGTNPFTAGDVVYFAEPWEDRTLEVGSYLWAYTGNVARLHNVGNSEQGYYSQQAIGGDIIALRIFDLATGYTFWDDTLDPVLGVVENSVPADYPAVAADLRSFLEEPSGATPRSQYYNLNWNTAWSPIVAPSAYGVGDWTVTDNGDGTGLTVDAPAMLADNGGSGIVRIEFDINSSGTWIDGGSTRSFVIAPADGITIGVAADIRIRAVTGVGRIGPASTAKTATAT